MTVPNESTPEVRAPLSLNQDFLCAFDKGDTDGAFGWRHTLVYGWRIRGTVDVATLGDALDDVITRHETLRTSIVRDEQPRHQRVHPPLPALLAVVDLPADPVTDRDERAERFLNDLESGTYSVRELPHLRIVLGRFDTTDAVLVLAAHHSATDAWSMQVLARDLMHRYAVRRGFTEHDLAPVHQYREFVDWQRSDEAAAAIARSTGYWREQLRDARFLGIPTDRPKDADLPTAYAVHRFLVDDDVATPVLAFAKATRSSPFMVLLAAYLTLLRDLTGEQDIAVPTFTSGRYQERFFDTVGPFFNFVALRVDLTGATTFRQVVERTRKVCIEAYSHDIPFGHVVPEAPAIVSTFGEPDRAVVAFEILQSPAHQDDDRIGDVEVTEMRRRLLSQEVSSAIPDGGLWAMDVLPSGELAGSLKYDANLVDEASAVELVAKFVDVLRQGVTAP
jgi:hypothetical protein